MIAELWAQEIINGHKTYSQVPVRLKLKVRELLTDKGHADLIIE